MNSKIHQRGKASKLLTTFSVKDILVLTILKNQIKDEIHHLIFQYYLVVLSILG